MTKLRQQNDGLALQVSLDTVQPLSETKSLTRQEFKDDCDINAVLRRYGALPPGRSLTYGAHNFDGDLTTAFETVQTAREAYDSLPKAVKELYPSWDLLAAAVAAGDANPALGKELDAAIAAKAKADADAESVKQKERSAVGVSPTDEGSSASEARQ